MSSLGLAWCWPVGLAGAWVVGKRRKGFAGTLQGFEDQLDAHSTCHAGAQAGGPCVFPAI